MSRKSNNQNREINRFEDERRRDWHERQQEERDEHRRRRHRREDPPYVPPTNASDSTESYSFSGSGLGTIGTIVGFSGVITIGTCLMYTPLAGFILATGGAYLGYKVLKGLLK